MEYPLFELKVLMFLQNKEGKLLFTDNSHEESIIQDYINPPGGHIEPGEDIEQTTKREVKEEMDINKIEDFRLRGFVNVFGFKEHPVLMFIVTANIPNTETPKPKSEGNPVWVDLKDMGRYKMFEDVELLAEAIKKTESGGVFNAVSTFKGKKLEEFKINYFN